MRAEEFACFPCGFSLGTPASSRGPETRGLSEMDGQTGAKTGLSQSIGPVMNR